ncbi:MAG: DUF2807 domain-containing protein [Sphingomicrobium sp.]
MRTFLPAALALAAIAAAAPADAATRNFGVSGFDRIRVDGPYTVRLATGVAPFAVASGSSAALDAISLDVQGRTLVVRGNRSSWGGYPGEAKGPVEISIGTHELDAAWVNGSGSLAIDRLRGLSFDLSMEGSGSARVGSVAVDQFKIVISGTASAAIAGVAPRLTATVRGVSSLDASGLTVKDATISAQGPATVKATVTSTAKVDALGAALVDLAGKPACTVRAEGSATVNGCR